MGNEVSGSIKYWNFLNSCGTAGVEITALLHGDIYRFIRSLLLQSSGV
jgi:hypothetical protein